MTVSANDRRYEYPGNGIATVRNGPKLFSASQLLVYEVDNTTQVPTLLSLGVHYTVSQIGLKQSKVTLVTPTPSGKTLLLLRTLPIDQETAIKNQGAFFPEIHEDALDVRAMVDQQLSDIGERSLRYRDTMIGAFDPELPLPDALKPLVWSATNPGSIENGDPTGTGDMLLRPNLADGGTPGRGAELVQLTPLENVAQRFGAMQGNNGANYIGAIQTGIGANGESLMAAYQRTVTPEQFGAVADGITNDIGALQAALNRAAGGVLRLTPGRTYAINDAMQIPSNTVLDARGATLKRLSGINNFIRNKGDGITGGYLQNANISIIGGTWTTDDAFAATSPCTVLGFTHCTGVWIRDCNILNPTDWHHIEINGCQAVFIDGCIIQQGANRALTTNEAIQIDANLGGGQWPWQGPADSTACSTVRVTNCFFNSVGTGVGTHSGAAGVVHNDIVVDNCTFFQSFYAGVHARGWSGVKINNCRFYEGGYGVFGDMQDTNVVNDYSITNNTFFRIGYTSFVTADARAVLLNGDAAGTQYARNFRITGNFVGSHNNAGKSRHALTANYCKQGVFANNVLQDINNGGIWAFGCDRVNIIGNEVINANIATGAAGILAGGTGSVNTTRINISSNVCDTMSVTQCDRTIVRNNIVTTAAGLTSSGNTNTTISENLVDTTFA